MKWIRTRNNFLNEAKLREVIFKQQAEEVKRMWGEKYLDYEEVAPTEKITQGKWKLSEEDKMTALGAFFECDMSVIFKTFENLPETFVKAINNSINTSLIQNNKERYERVLEDFNISKPSIDQIVALFDPVFRKLNVNETIGTEEIQKDENGRPVRDAEGQMIKVAKEAGEARYEKNLVNIHSFVETFNRAYPDNQIRTNHFHESNLSSLVNLAKDDCEKEYQVDFEIFNKDLYLNITHNPKDILNMSISKFYSSCQHLYSGGHRKQLLGNVFDPNSIPAFLTFETPIYWKDEKISEQLPLSRMIVRSIESFDNKETKIYFDRAYPDRMKEKFDDIVEKYAGMKKTTERGLTYLFTPDIQEDDTDIKDPYMDRLDIERVPYIGANTKSLYINRINDWSKVKISPKANIKEAVIETTNLPKNFFDLKMNLDWVKFKFLKINSFGPFANIKTNSVAFDKCKMSKEVFNSVASVIGDIKKLQVISCDINGIDLRGFASLEELHLVYTLNSFEELKEAIGEMKLGKLVISGDLVDSPAAKEWIKAKKNSGTKIEIKGPVV
jgi:hypothetical protein